MNKYKVFLDVDRHVLVNADRVWDSDGMLYFQRGTPVGGTNLPIIVAQFVLENIIGYTLIEK